MTDDAAKPDDTGPKSPAQLPPSTAPAPTERLETASTADTAAVPPAKPYEPPPAYVPPTATATPVTVQHGNNGLAVLFGIVSVVALLAAGYSYYLNHDTASSLSARLDDLEQRLATAEKRPIPAPVDLRPIDQREAALDQRLAALERKPANQLDAAGQAEIAQLAGRIDQMLARQDQLGQREQTDFGKLTDQLTAQDGRIAAQDARITTTSQAGSATGGQVSALATHEQRLALLQAASGALAAGRPLGVIPGAPPALAQFADKPPPTEAALRLSFADAARAAHEAGMPIKEDAPLLSRMWARAQSSVTIRQGDHVVVGDAVSDIIAKAQSQLDAGDLAGAVATLGEMTGAAFTAMAPWKARAQSLLDARAALLTLARG